MSVTDNNIIIKSTVNHHKSRHGTIKCKNWNDHIYYYSNTNKKWL